MIFTPPKATHKRVKVPTVYQLENAECGAASLTMILKYYKRRAELDQIRRLCNITARDGSSVADLIRVAESFGLNAKGFRMGSLSVTNVQFPVIIHWNFNHFIVFEGYKKGTYYLRDSCTGGFTVTRDEFDKNFTGVVIRFSGQEAEGLKENDSVESETKQESMAKCSRTCRSKTATIIEWIKDVKAQIHKLYVSPFSAANILYSLLSCCVVLLGVSVPVIVQTVFDSKAIHGENFLTSGVTPLLYLLIGYAVLIYSQQILLSRNKQQSAEQLATRVFRRLLKLPAMFFVARYSAGSRVFTCSSIYESSFNAIVNPILSLGALILLIFKLSVIAPVQMCWLIPIIITALIVQVQTNRNNYDIKKKVAVKTQAFLQASTRELQLIEPIKSMGTQQHSFQRWAKGQASLENETIKLKLKGIYTSSVVSLLRSLCMVIIIIGFCYYGSALTTGTLIALFIITTLSFKHIETAAGLFSAIEAGKNGIHSLDDIMMHEKAIFYGGSSDKQEKESLDEASTKLDGAVELKEVSFGYNRFAPAQIDAFSLKVSTGEVLGILGGSGSGKTIIGKLIAALYQPWSGEVLFDGILSSELPSSRIGNSIALVEQRTNIFHGSFSHNISLFNRDIPHEEIERACSLACIHEDIVKRPHGYNTILKDGGINISGGQRQRIEIARALLTQPSILILDEALCALDTFTMINVINNIRSTGCTCIILSHNQSVAAHCDRHISLEENLP